MNAKATKQQIIALNTILSKKGLMDDKAALIADATNGRTVHSSDLLFLEAKALLQALNKGWGKVPAADPRQRMVRKLFALAHEMGWIKERQYVTPAGQMMKDKDYSALHGWIKKYGYLHKDLNHYTYEELPRLLTQFENGPYKHYMQKL